MNVDYINNPELLIFKDSENVAYTKEHIDEKLSKTSFITTKSNKVMINGVFTNIDTDNNLPVCKDSNLYISDLYAEKLLSVSFGDIKDYISFEKDGKTLKIILRCDNIDAEFVKMEALPLESSPQRTDEAESKNDEFTKLCVHLENVKDVKISMECMIEGSNATFYDFSDLEKWN